MAWILGYKSDRLALSYGGTSWLNLLLLFNMDENVDYSLILSQGHGFHSALIAFAGAGIANGLSFALSLRLLNTVTCEKNLMYSIFSFYLM